MIVRECTHTYYVLFVGGSACLGSEGPVRGMCNHVHSAKHKVDMSRLS
jgi:hypothetical protein